MIMIEEQIQLLIPVLNRIEMPWENRGRSHDEHPWNGKALNLDHRSIDGISHLVHDMGHWLVATPKKRKLPDFDADMDDEIEASLLGILMERKLGFPWRSTWLSHSWESVRWSARRDIKKLQARGLIVGLTPVCFL
jgi:hypothetical protein